MKMAKKERKFKKPFAAALHRCMLIKGETNDDVGRAVGYKSEGKAIDQIRNERSDGREFYRRAIAYHFGYEYQKFIDFGQKLIDEQDKNEQDKNKHLNVISLLEKHKELIDRFDQKTLALQINELLLEIEKISPESLGRALYQLQVVKKLEEDKIVKKRNAGNQAE